ncbi:hypothetical protein CHU92_14240 [Flavobacterium cyanobacteriorum]|uniref:T9SS C-terminal target domain-containing protein n=2 Tax=Flavobacterium cyanobacteriorum TaxID=2022802 RepID=A0A255YV05_9FLAO|nr:hypothetical protein CHU92_14240 [Flavobacterium cyanobacteriorum]
MKINAIVWVLLFSAVTAVAQVPGCTDPLAGNYNPDATINDGSCTYPPASVNPVASVGLSPVLKETSGLILWGSSLYTHNDDTDINLYAIDPGTGAVGQPIPINGVSNQDWEDVAQDEDYIYIGDFGNNANGNRTDLRIIKVAKTSLLNGEPVTANINFSYAGQTDYTAKEANHTDFDCEALIASADSLYLFTKQWISKKTSLYVLPKEPGTYQATLKATFDTQGLITGAVYIEDKKIVVLTGYSTFLQPFLYLLYGFNGHDFFSGNKRKLRLGLSFHQIEGIAGNNGIDFYVTNEKFAKAPFIDVPQKLHHFSLAPFLQPYISIATAPGPDGKAR